MSKRGRIAFNLCVILLLLLLFTLPRIYLNRVCRELTALTNLAENLCLSGEEAAPALLRLQTVYATHDRTLKLFLDHSSVDAAGAAIAACTPLMEPDALISALHTVGASLSHLRGIESLTPESLF